MSEAVIFKKCPDLSTPVSTDLNSPPLLTKRFKSHLVRVQNWSLKPTPSHISLRKCPEFVSGCAE